MATDSSYQRGASVCRPPKRISIKDIAVAAGVSHSTVSRALEKSPLVRQETAENIQRIAQQMGYRVSAIARGLATNRTRTIGVVVTTIADPFVGEVVSGIEEAANEHGYSVFLANSNAEPEREINVVHSFEERRVEGIVVTASRVGALYIPMLSEMRVPVVLINNQRPGEFVHSVMIANVAASREATSHLIGLGHRRIAYLGDQFGYQSDTERFAGYREALEQADLPFQPGLVVHADGRPEGAMQAMERLLALPQLPTAVFCYNDMSALGALKRIRLSGLRVPDDISLVGFDDLFLAQYTDPPLTTVRQPKHYMGRLAMETLLRLLSGSTSEENVKVPGELVIRESTAPPK
jgi:DNA-binding LacI/PurR family transcriptional regulator